jgi:hypothetical protein
VEQNVSSMYPAVPPPKGLVGRSIDYKLKPGWRYDTVKKVFVDAKGAQFAPRSLGKKSRVVYKVPGLAKVTPERLSKAERDLQRYMQIILPPSRSPQGLLKAVQSWPCVEEAHVAPEISLPTPRST